MGAAQPRVQDTQKRTLQKFNKNQLLSVLEHGGVAHLGAQSTQKRTLQKFNKNQLLSVPNHGGVAHLGERLNGIQEVRGSIPLISTIGH